MMQEWRKVAVVYAERKEYSFRQTHSHQSEGGITEKNKVAQKIGRRNTGYKITTSVGLFMLALPPTQ